MMPLQISKGQLKKSANQEPSCGVRSLMIKKRLIAPQNTIKAEKNQLKRMKIYSQACLSSFVSCKLKFLYTSRVSIQKAPDPKVAEAMKDVKCLDEQTLATQSFSETMRRKIESEYKTTREAFKGIIAYISQVESDGSLIDAQHLSHLTQAFNKHVNQLSKLNSYTRQLAYNAQPQYEEGTPAEQREEAAITEKLLMERIGEIVPSATWTKNP